MKYFILLLFVLMLTSCDPVPKKGADGYVFGQPQYQRNQVDVNIVTYSKREFDKQLVKRKLPNTTAAFTELKYPYDVCTIHMIDPATRYEPEFVGHEFLHCVYGQWHTNNTSKS
jgi:hypothetical protein